MVIDLTQDSDSDDQNHQTRSPPKSNQHIHPFLADLAHRTPSSLSLIPLKRKLEKSPELDPNNVFFKRHSLAPSVAPSIAPSVASESDARHQNLTNNVKLNGYTVPRELQPSTPSPTPAVVTVVVPSPSNQLKKEIETAEWAPKSQPLTSRLTALSEQYYPTDAYEKRGRKGIYPGLRKVNRAAARLPIGTPDPILKKKPNVQDELLRTLERKLTGIDGPSVTFAPGDGHNLANCTANFEFINSYRLRKGVSLAPAEFIGGCSCGKFCDPEKCPCSEKEENSTANIIPYQRAKDRSDILVLTPDFLKRTTMILECGAQCTCDESCWNRVVQRGRTVRLEIFNTGRRGFGLRSPDYIRKGQFIDCYLGEVIDKKSADVREEIALKRGHSYLFGLDFFPEVEEEDMYVVDGQRFGSCTRFMNHSCRPNCRMFPVTHTIGDVRLYDLAFFALRDVPPMTELTFDYNPGAERSKQVDPSAFACLCGEDNCRGQLWPNQRKGIK
ncbi:hypothetical protein BDV28DRAFT_34470 [Aspergillus coremiiformis]|uniref:Uncharacterized protein n=1 Tax=Aspergillus coremiiformis TaxID=138285 RepID=A0A5N6ZFH7_9EURO|nr:hypothetical protein BDV28DRAFT_34470 [Aspergillus coremiiformis]